MIFGKSHYKYVNHFPRIFKNLHQKNKYINYIYIHAYIRTYIHTYTCVITEPVFV